MSTNPLDDHLDLLGGSLASRTSRADRRRRRALAGGALSTAALAAGLSAAALLSGGAPNLDPVSEARAAVAPNGKILHLRVAFAAVPSRDVGRDPMNPIPYQGVDVWMTTSGEPRWRRAPASAGTAPGQCSSRLFLSPLERSYRGPRVTLVGPDEDALAGRVMSTYSRFSRAVVIRRISERESRYLLSPLWFGLGGGLGADRDPVATIRTALDSGRLRDAGETTLDGRRVRKLVGTAPPLTPAPAPKTSDLFEPPRLTYYVDATSFAPVELRTQNFAVSRADGRRVVRELATVNIARFGGYTHLADTPANRKLLELKPPAGTAIVRLTPSGKPRNPDALPGRVLITGASGPERACRAARRAAP